MPLYSETLRYLFSLHRFGIRLGIETITNLLRGLGNPHRCYPTLHIGGTNGKGSSASMAASILQMAGYRVGLYTSPHLIDFRERIRVNNEHIPEHRVCELTDRIRQAMHSSTSSTFFEFTTAMAFQHFSDQNVDIAVVEVGMGGRFDATNVLAPLAVLITGIALDHEEHLGTSLPMIAKEKAGIIHSDAPVVLGPMDDHVANVFVHHAKSCHAPTVRFGQDYRMVPSRQSFFTYHGSRWHLPDMQTNLCGDHQKVNAANTLALLEAIDQQTFSISELALREGLQRVDWKGRMEVLQHQPMIVLDGAHNPSAAQVLFDFLYSQIHDGQSRRLILILGMMADKNHPNFLNVLRPLIDILILTQPKMAGAATVETLRMLCQHDSFSQQIVPDSWQALCQAQELANPTDLICVTGSLYLVGEVAKSLSERSFPTL